MHHRQMFDPKKSLFAGMSREQLQAALDNAQAAYIALLSGGQAVTVSYTQGDGARSVTYEKPNSAGLAALISELQAMLGIRREPREPVRFVYR